MDLRKVMRTPVATCSPDTTLSDAALHMEREGIGSLVVVDEDRAVGMVTDRDLVMRGLARRLGSDTAIREVMTPGVTSVRAGQDPFEAAAMMAAYGVRRLPVVDDAGTPIGIIAVDDVMMLLAKEAEHLGRAISAQSDRTHYAGWADWDG